MATKHSDDLVQEAKDTADKIIGEARAKAERLENEARGKADRMTGEARARAEKLDGEIAERRAQMLGSLEKQKGQLERTIDDLHAYEREYRSRLKTYFTEQLKALGNGDDTLSPRNGFRPEARAQAHVTASETSRQEAVLSGGTASSSCPGPFDTASRHDDVLSGPGQRFLPAAQRLDVTEPQPVRRKPQQRG
jgi:vacuolar-type H+-ATPase subunit H